MSDKYRAIVLIGLPGTGKGTQGKALGCLPGFHYFSSGEMFRLLDRQTEVGRRVHGLIDGGNFVPDELVVSLWRDEMQRRIEAGRFRPERDWLLLDGLPRTVPQAEVLEAHIDLLQVVSLGCDDEQQLVERLLHRAAEEHRQDDDLEVIRHRLDVYHRLTAPLLSHYPAERIAAIDALGTPMEVLDRILHALIPLQDRLGS